MQITTVYGTIDSENINLSDLTPITRNFIQGLIESSSIFFVEDTTIEKGKNTTEIQELILHQATTKFDDPSRAFALSECVGVILDDIAEGNEVYELTVSSLSDDSEYYVLTDSEADALALDYVRDYVADLNFLDLNVTMQEEIKTRKLLNMTWFDDAQKEYTESTVYDLKDEDADDSDLYINALHERMVSDGVLNYPEWPEEEEYMEPHTTATENRKYPDEPESADFADISGYERAHSNWDSEQELLDDLEKECTDSFKSAKIAYSGELENMVEEAQDDFVQALMTGYGDSFSYYVDNFGEESVNDIITKNNLMDKDAVASLILEFDGREHSIPSYDGKEQYQTVVFDGKRYEYYIYKR